MSKSNWWIGAVLIALGIMILLNNLDVTQIDIGRLISTYWPVILVIWGVNLLVRGRGRGGSWLSAALLFIIGLVLLGITMEILEMSMATFWKFFWPVVLIAAGVSLLKGPLSGGKNNIAFLSGLDRTGGKWKLENGNYWAFLGGIDLDLRRAEIEEKEYFISCTAILGGIDITVPTDLTIICNGTAVLGGVEFLGEGSGGIIGSSSVKHEAQGESRAVVNIYTRAILGGVEVNQKD